MKNSCEKKNICHPLLRRGRQQSLWWEGASSGIMSYCSKTVNSHRAWELTLNCEFVKFNVNETINNPAVLKTAYTYMQFHISTQIYTKDLVFYCTPPKLRTNMNTIGHAVGTLFSKNTIHFLLSINETFRLWRSYSYHSSFASKRGWDFATS